MKFDVDTERTGAAAPRRRSEARQAMDTYVDTGTWFFTVVSVTEVDTAVRRLYTMAHKAGYAINTERVPVIGDDGQPSGSIRLRMLCRTKARKEHI